MAIHSLHHSEFLLLTFIHNQTTGFLTTIFIFTGLKTQSLIKCYECNFDHIDFYKETVNMLSFIACHELYSYLFIRIMNYFTPEPLSIQNNTVVSGKNKEPVRSCTEQII